MIHRRDGSGSIDVVRGRIADDTGAIGFLSGNLSTMRLAHSKDRKRSGKRLQRHSGNQHRFIL